MRLTLLPGLLLLVTAAACGPGGDDAAECSGMLPGDLVITEVLADFDAPTGSSGADEGREWFEIYNASGGPVELAGLVLEHGRITDEMPDRHTMRAVTIGAGEYLVLGNVLPDLAPAHVDYGYANDLDSLYNSDGGKLALRCGTTVVDEAVYDMVEPGKTRALDGGSPPDYQLNDDLANWCEPEEVASFEYEPANFGTPGAANPDCMVVTPGTCDDNGTPRPTVPPQIGDLVITEVMPSPAAVSDTAGEWIEVLVNRDLDYNDLGLDRIDDSSNPVIQSSATCLHATAGTYLVFAKNADALVNGGLEGVDGLFNFALVAGSVAAPTGVRLMMGTVELDAMSWTSARNGRAIQLDMGLTTPADNDLSTNLCDATATYGAGDFGTPGLANSDCGQVTTGMCMDTGTMQLRPIVKPTPGQLVIDEWMPDPTHVTDANGEWFEVRATAAVDLNGLQGGTASLNTILVPAMGNCLRLDAGERAVFARTSGATNGLPSTVTVAGVFGGTPGFSLTNGASMFQIGIDGGNLATATWATASAVGGSWMLDTDATQCTATAAGVPAYNNGAVPGTDRGTPGAVNSPPECP